MQNAVLLATKGNWSECSCERQSLDSARDPELVERASGAADVESTRRFDKAPSLPRGWRSWPRERCCFLGDNGENGEPKPWKSLLRRS
jgi:hypothetical protein